MIIYSAEKSIPGLAEKIIANSSIAYNTQILPWTPSEREEVQKNTLLTSFNSAAKNCGHSLASAYDDDLYFTKSILVSTNWNNNDDVFTADEVWAARHTPSHKPTNVEHDPTKLVGHITETWALDAQGDILADNCSVDELPDLYHIANGAVIYNNWRDDELKERAASLIEGIEKNEKYVSMECLFNNFSYAIVTPEEEYHVVARNQETSFLTKCLRCYGGTGEFDGCKVGRILKNITFSGKGYVDKPANPHSIIFSNGNVFNSTTASTKNPFRKENGVLFSYSSSSTSNKTENNLMSDNTLELLKSQNQELKDAVAKLESKNEELATSASKLGIEALQSDIDSLKASLEATDKERDEANATIETLKSEKETLSTQLTEANEVKQTLETQVAEANAEKVKANRISHLVDNGVSKEVATTKVEVFANLNDEQFSSVAEDIISAAEKTKKDDKKEDKEDKEDKKDKKDKKESKSSESDISDDPQESNASEDVLDNVEESESVDMTVDASNTDKDEIEAARASLRQAIASQFGLDSSDETE